MLVLLPNLLDSAGDHHLQLPAAVDGVMKTIDGLIAESEGGARRYLSRFNLSKKVQHVPVMLLNKNTKPKEYDFMLEPLLEGQTWGLISDAGLPCLADPGAGLVLRARERKVKIEAISGPSSISLALMQSGLGGQHFCFRGYIAKDPQRRKNDLRRWQTGAHQEKSTQIFIEAPYRNQYAFEECLNTLDDKTLLCVATCLTTPEESVTTHLISHYKKNPLLNLNKKPTIFLFR